MDPPRHRVGTEPPGIACVAGGIGRRTLVAEPAISWRQLTEEALAALPGRRITTDLDGRIVRIEAPAE